MNRLEAEKALKESDVNMRYVSLYGELRDECIILERLEPDGWCVYYSERGGRTDERCFLQEEDACNYIFALVSNNRTFRNRL